MISPLDRAESYLAEQGMLGLPGAVLYSGEKTLQPGPVYLIGLNPGGNEGATLKDSISSSRVDHNAYLDEVWSPGGYPQPKGQSTLQRRIQHLCGVMGLETRDVPASNLAFTRSPRIDAHEDFEGAAKACFPVHQIFLDAIRPKFLMTFGSLSNFSKVVKTEAVESRPAEHGSWRAHRGNAVIGNEAIAFGNVPHLSLWASNQREDVLRWALQKLIG